MIHTHCYDALALSAKAWDGVGPGVVHIDMRKADAPSYHPDIGYLSISPDMARVLAHQLMVAAERCDSMSQPEAAAA